MTTIVNSYVGITHPIGGENMDKKEYDLILKAWKISNCPQGIHLFDEVWSDSEHCLYCDACEMVVNIASIEIPDGKDQEI